MPVFIADPVCNGDVWQLGHDCPRGSVHELESTLIVWLLKAIFVGKPRSQLDVRIMREIIKLQGVNRTW
jgi:hypothetical protein